MRIPLPADVSAVFQKQANKPSDFICWFLKWAFLFPVVPLCGSDLLLKFNESKQVHEGHYVSIIRSILWALAEKKQNYLYRFRCKLPPTSVFNEPQILCRLIISASPGTPPAAYIYPDCDLNVPQHRNSLFSLKTCRNQMFCNIKFRFKESWFKEDGSSEVVSAQ